MDDHDFHDARMRIEQERLCHRLEATERASNRLLQEINDLRRELDALQSENASLRRERAELADILADGLGPV